MRIIAYYDAYHPIQRDEIETEVKKILKEGDTYALIPRNDRSPEITTLPDYK